MLIKFFAVKLSFLCDNEVLVVKFVHMLINFFVVKLSFLRANEGFIQAHFFIDF